MVALVSAFATRRLVLSTVGAANRGQTDRILFGRGLFDDSGDLCLLLARVVLSEPQSECSLDSICIFKRVDMPCFDCDDSTNHGTISCAFIDTTMSSPFYSCWREPNLRNIITKYHP